MFAAVTGAGLLLIAVAADAAAQTTQAAKGAPQTASTRLRVFLDCDCYEDFLRDEIKFVDFVRQPQDADMHLLARTSETGGGGRETALRFIGRGRVAEDRVQRVSVRGLRDAPAAPAVRRRGGAARYNEITLYDECDETHPRHEASTTFERQGGDGTWVRLR